MKKFDLLVSHFYKDNSPENMLPEPFLEILLNNGDLDVPRIRRAVEIRRNVVLGTTSRGHSIVTFLNKIISVGVVDKRRNTGSVK